MQMKKREKKTANPAIDKATVQYLAALESAIDAGDSGKKNLQTLLIQRPIDANILTELARIFRGSGRRQHQQDAANIKHSQTKKAKEFASQKWVLTRHQFTSNIGFCRAVVPFVLKKFNVVVTPETIARDWVKGFDSPHADTRPENAIAYTGGRYFAQKKLLTLASKE